MLPISGQPEYRVFPMLLPKPFEMPLEMRPHVPDRIQQPGAMLVLQRTVVVPARLGGEVQEQVGDHRAQVESDRAVVSEFGIDHLGGRFGHKDASGMQIPVDQRFPVRQELLP
ncbi:hypothetical protein D1872_308370 [compost metagenome]